MQEARDLLNTLTPTTHRNVAAEQKSSSRYPGATNDRRTALEDPNIRDGLEKPTGKAPGSEWYYHHALQIAWEEGAIGDGARLFTRS